MKALEVLELIVSLLPEFGNILDNVKTEGNSEEIEKAEALVVDLLNGAIKVLRALGK